MNYELLKNEPMSKHTTFKTGGCADTFYRIFDFDGLNEVLDILNKNGEKPLIIGNGSNLLVSDMGPGVPVIEIGEGMSEVICDGDMIEAQAGARLSKVSRVALENSL
ncbi:MAG: UDP-N-acetylenolpyruvoylglucosamine reductase, partial [Eubacterium sp.]|nr:UDP-N-acetylenolpyruvoylglucosamine reductase [Eubacterium sp.]